jgi:hypothetical protein
MLSSRLTLAATVLAMTFALGCSRDKHEVNSTHHMPATLQIIDTLNGQTVWSMDVPVGQRLIYDFDYDNAAPEFMKSPNAPANRMKWWTVPSYVQGNYNSYSTRHKTDGGTVELPGTPILAKVVYHESTRATQPRSLTDPVTARELPPIRLEVDVLEDGSIIFDGSPRSTRDIGPLFRSLYGERRVIISGTPGTPRANLLELQDKIEDSTLTTIIIPPADSQTPAQPAPVEQAPEANDGDDANAADILDEAMGDK